jgi:hypothetical protein
VSSTAVLMTILVGVLQAAQVPGTSPSRPPESLAQSTTVAAPAASISGSVVVAGSGQKAKGALMMLSGGEPRTSRSATTDPEGRFSFTQLPAGSYTLNASKPGYVDVAYGQTRAGAGRAGTPIQLEDGQRFEVRIQIPRGGVLTGTVLSQDGEAIPGIPVRTMRYVFRSGRRTLLPAANGATDDRGVFRVYGLQPGDYIVYAVPSNSGNVAAVQNLRKDLDALRASRGTQPRIPAEDELVTGYAPVYYPGTTEVASAVAVMVGPGDERAGIDFQLQLTPIARVEGTVSSAAGQAENIQVTLVNAADDTPGVGALSVQADPDGHFRLMNVPPGQYNVVARAMLRQDIGSGAREAQAFTQAATRGALAALQQPVRLWGLTTVSVDGRNVANVTIALRAGVTVSGNVVFDGIKPRPTDLSHVRVDMVPWDATMSARGLASQVSVQADAAGHFSLAGVLPGQYRFVAVAPNGWFLRSALVGDQDALDFPTEVKPGQNLTAEITFTDREAELTGSVANASDGAHDLTIILFPTDQRYRIPNSPRIMSTRPATDGRFAFRNIPPGEYYIAPVTDPEPESWFDVAFLRQLDPGALRVTIGEGERKMQNLRVVGGRQ